MSYYLQGHSIISIIRELKNQDIKSPTGKDNWSKRAVETVLTNEKYVGKVILGKTYGSEFPSNKRYINRGDRDRHVLSYSHEPIISEDIFNAITVERKKISNVVIVDGKAVRKSTHYRCKEKN